MTFSPKEYAKAVVGLQKLVLLNKGVTLFFLYKMAKSREPIKSQKVMSQEITKLSPREGKLGLRKKNRPTCMGDF